MKNYTFIFGVTALGRLRKAASRRRVTLAILPKGKIFGSISKATEQEGDGLLRFPVLPCLI